MNNNSSPYFLRSKENSAKKSDSSLTEGKQNKKKLINNINEIEKIPVTKYALMKKKTEVKKEEIKELYMESLLLEPLIEDSITKNKKKELILKVQKPGEVKQTGNSITDKNSKILQVSSLPQENAEKEKIKSNVSKNESNILNIFEKLELQKRNNINNTPHTTLQTKEVKVYDDNKKKNLKRKTESISASVEEEIIKKNRRKNR